MAPSMLPTDKTPAAPRKRGRLKVFLGMSPGVGKTYEMLRAARRRKAEGDDVVVGVVETHGRKETMSLLRGLEVMARNPAGLLWWSLGDHDRAIRELDAALQGQQLSLILGTLSGELRLIAPLEAVLSDADVLLAVTDPQVFNRNTAQSLFLTSYRYRGPVLGYSQSLTRAGALLSLHSSPAQIGRQTAESVIAALQGSSVRLPVPDHPTYFSISINEQVARSLGYTLLPEAELEKRLGAPR